MIKKMSFGQRKIIIQALIISAVFLIIWLFIFIPAKNKIEGIKTQLSKVENQINKIESAAGPGKSLKEKIDFLRKEYLLLKGKFPVKEEDSLKMAAELAKDANIEIISIRPMPKKILVDKDEKEVKVEGKNCYVVYVSVFMKCLYKDLAGYLESLDKKLPAFVTIESMHIIRDTFNRTAKQEVTLDFNMYFLY